METERRKLGSNYLEPLDLYIHPSHENDIQRSNDSFSWFYSTVDQRCVRLLDPGQLTVTGPNAGTVRYGIGRKAECVQRIAAGCRAFVQWPQTDGLDGAAQTFHFLAQPFTVAIGFDVGLVVGMILQRDFLLLHRQIER